MPIAKGTIVRPILERFWAMVEKGAGNECWLWMGGMNANGYGKFWDHTRDVPAHRFSYEQEHGTIPNGQELDYLCRNHACVNPKHLEAVAHRENCLRGVGASAIAVRKTHCPQGHPYDLINTKYSKIGWRYCRPCRLEQQRNRRAAK